MMSKAEVLAAMRKDIGQESEPGEWFSVTQKFIDDYVELTGETGWIHTDVERAKQSSFGNTIAPGNMGIAILPQLDCLARSTSVCIQPVSPVSST